MKIKIKNFNGELPDYLTMRKVYDLEQEFNVKDVVSGYIQPDYLDSEDDEDIFIILDDCSHLNGGSWEIINENN